MSDAQGQEKMVNIVFNGVKLLTPGKYPFAVPTAALADAIDAEWQAHGKFSVSKMPLTSLAYTAIDQIESQKDMIVEVLLAYVDTDTLSYRAGGSEKLAKQQALEWNPIVEWAEKILGTKWIVTTGVMPLEQAPELHAAVNKYLQKLSPMHLSACCFLASGLSSLLLALAVLAKQVDASEAFRLSRLEEEAQSEIWGRDSEAEARALRLKEEILSSARFLDLLDR